MIELLVGPVVALGDADNAISAGEAVTEEVLLEVVHLVHLSLLLLEFLIKELLLRVQVTAPAVRRQVVMLRQFLRSLFLGGDRSADGGSSSQRLRFRNLGYSCLFAEIDFIKLSHHFDK